MGGDVVGGINSEIARLMKISMRNLKLGRGKHTTQTKRVKYSCARKKKVGRSRLQKNIHMYLNFFGQWYAWFIRKYRTGTDLWVINAKNADGYDIETVCL